MNADQSTVPDSPIPARLNAALKGRYRVLHRIGEGGMATVFLAEDLKHDRRVAVKVMNPDQASSVAPERFLREISIAAKLSHPHILPVYDSGQAEDLLFYVMPLVEGETLRQRLQREKQLPVEEAIEIISHVAGGLSFAHSRGVIHRDVKPENILLHSGQAVIADFGIARAVTATGEATVTKAGIIVGTPQYMSPEQVAGDDLDARSDIYALACVLYELLAGRAPHVGATSQEVYHQKLSGTPPPSLVDLRATVTPALDAAITRALSASRADRPATCDEFMQQIRGTVSHSGPRMPLRLPQPRTLRRLGLVVGALAVIAIAIGVWRVVQPLAATGNAIAVFPFRPSGAGAEDWSEAVADLLATALDGTPGVQVADPWTLWRPLRPDRAAVAQSPDPDEAQRLARAAGASRMVLGTVVRAGAQLTITARVYRGGTEIAQGMTVTGSEDSIAGLVQQLAVRVIGAVWGSDSTPDIRGVTSYATRSPDALKAYLVAREAMRRGMVDSAERAIGRAIGLDTTFALALVEAVTIKSWAQSMRGEQYSGLIPLAEAALRHGDSLSERNRLRAVATLAAVRTDGAAAAAAVRRIIAMDSTDIEAWSALSYYDRAYGWQYGATVTDARAAAARAVALDSTYAPALVALAWLDAGAGTDRDLGAEISRLEQADTSSALVSGTLAGLRALVADSATFAATVQRLATRPREEWLPLVRMLRTHDADRTEQLLRAVQAAPGGGATGIDNEIMRMQLARGRLGPIDSAMATGAFAEVNSGLAFNTLVWLVAADLADMSNHTRATAAVQTLAAYLPADSALAMFNRRSVWWLGWLVGAWNATHGDTAIAHQWQAAMLTLPEGGTTLDYRRAIVRDVDARLAARRGDLQAAIDAGNEAYTQWGIHSDAGFEAQPSPGIRLHLALSLRAAGQADSAAVLLHSLIAPTTWLGFTTARAAFELGTIAEDQRDFGAAVRYYDMALRLWRGGDEAIAEWRTRAEDGMERARRQGG